VFWKRNLDAPGGSAGTTAHEVVRDTRTRPAGVVPRHLQTWIMVGLTAALLAIILISGRPTAPRGTANGKAQPITSLSPEQLHQYQEQLTEQEARLRREMAENQAAQTAAAHAGTPGNVSDPDGPPDPLQDERRRRVYSSLFADNVAFTRRRDAAGTTAPRPADADPAGAEALIAQALTRALVPPQPAPPPATPPSSPPAAATPNVAPSSLSPSPNTKRLLEGTVIEAVLINRLDGSFNGPVSALVTSPVYTHDRASVLIPSGARVLGTVSPVQAFGESRLAVKFHRLVMPNGATCSLDRFPGLNERGDAGLKDQVDRHYLQLFGASIAIGALSGLTQYSTRTANSDGYEFSDAYRQGTGASVAASGARMLDRFLNVLPTITIREGHRIKIYLTADLDLPPWSGL
jgi:type IV secretory pathway VirB10-like protein